LLLAEDNIFCVESGSKIGTSTNGEVAREKRKLYVLNQGELILWNNRKYDILEQILTAKFSFLKFKISLVIKDSS
jgi:hypothetical protein